MPVGAEPTKPEIEAAEWLVLLDSASVPHSEIERFQAWLGASEENKAAYAAVSSTWDKLGPVLASMPREVVQGGPIPANDRGPDTVGARVAAGRRNWTLPAIAAAAFVAALVLVPLPDFSLFQPSTAYATQVREIRTIALADGTRAQLSPLAQMRVAYDGRARRIWLKQGVAYFEVAPDARPFLVSTRFGEVRSMARAFVVRVEGSSAVVTVLDGALSVSGDQGSSLLARFAAHPPVRVLRAGDEAMLGARAPSVEHVAASVVQNRLAWRDGHVALDHARLEDAALEVTRFSGARFVFADPGLGDVRVSGYFDGGDVDAFVAALRRNFGLETERRDDTIILRSRRPSQ